MCERRVCLRPLPASGVLENARPPSGHLSAYSREILGREDSRRSSKSDRVGKLCRCLAWSFPFQSSVDKPANQFGGFKPAFFRELRELGDLLRSEENGCASHLRPCTTQRHTLSRAIC